MPNTQQDFFERLLLKILSGEPSPLGKVSPKDNAASKGADF